MKTLTAEPNAATSLAQKPAQNADTAFTRIELATVLAVLALVTLLLIPALARSRANDHSFQCQNNLRQLISGWRMYAADNGDRLTESMYWVSGFMQLGNNAGNTNILLIQQCKLWPYVKSLPTFRCLADQSYNSYGGVRVPRTRSYSMNQAINNSSPQWQATTYRVYYKYSDIVAPTPAGLWALVDEHPDSINDGGFAVNMYQQGATAVWQDGPANYHEGSCGFSFADGHTEMHRWKDPRTFLGLPVTYSIPFTYGISQPNSPDIAWVQARTTALK